MSVVLCDPSIPLSSTPVTVTVCAVFQLLLVKVRLDALTVASPVSPEVTVITTSLEGWAVNTTVKASVPPASVTDVLPLVSVTVKPAESLSVVVTATVLSARESKLLSLELSFTDNVRVVLCDPSISLSSTPVTVTVCVEFQLLLVKVRLEALSVASPISPEVTAITTSLEGCAVKTTVKVSVPPASVTDVLPPVSVTVKPAESLSVIVAVTVWSARESKLSSLEPSFTASVIVVLCDPSIPFSSTPVTVTVCAVFQLLLVKVKLEALTVASPVSPEVTVITTSLEG